MHQRYFLYLYFALCALVFWPLATPLGSGLILGYLCESPIERLAARLRLRGSLQRLILSAVLLSLVVLGILLPLLFLALRGVRELSEWVSSITSAGLGPNLPAFSGLRQKLVAWHVPLPSSAELVVALREAATRMFSPMLSGLGRAAAATPGVLLAFGVFLITWWSSAALGKDLRQRLIPHLIPWPEQRMLICSVTSQVVRGLILANLLVAAIQSLLCTLCLWLLSVPHPLALGLLSLPLSFVPMVGTTIITLGSAVYLFLQGRNLAGVLMLAVAVVVGIVDNLIRPLILHEQLNVPVVLLFLSLVGGVLVFGLLGVLIGPLSLALCLAALSAQEQ